MRLTRIYVDLELHAGDVVELPRDTGAHLAKVLRARSGDSVILFNGDGREWSGTLDGVRGSRIAVAVGAPQAVNRESPLAITLLQSVPRGDRMDFVVQKATELGVAHIVPVMTQRSVVRLDAAQAESKRLHWHAVAVSACEQCGRARLPVIDTPRPLLGFLGEIDRSGGIRWVFEPEDGGTGALGRDLGPSAAPGPALPESGARLITIAIGPEGGFAPEELDAFKVCGFIGVGLGPRVLRTETAAIAAIVWLQARLGDMAAIAHAPASDAAFPG